MPARCLYTLTAIRSVLLSWCKLYMHSPLIKSMKMTHLTVPVFDPHISKLCINICNEGFKHCNLFRISLTYSFNCWTVLLICQLFVNPRLQYMLFSSTEVNFHCTIQMSLYVCIDVNVKRKSTRRSTAVQSASIVYSRAFYIFILYPWSALVHCISLKLKNNLNWLEFSKNMKCTIMLAEEKSSLQKFVGKCCWAEWVQRAANVKNLPSRFYSINLLDWKTLMSLIQLSLQVGVG